MNTKAITLNIPQPIYEHFKQRAEQFQRTIEDELLQVVSSAAPEEGLPLALAEEIESMTLFSDKALWKAARSRLPAAQLKKLNQLNYKQQKEGRATLTEDELKVLNELLYQHDRFILIRAHAAVLLKRRGHDISSLAPKAV